MPVLSASSRRTCIHGQKRTHPHLQCLPTIQSTCPVLLYRGTSQTSRTRASSHFLAKKKFPKKFPDKKHRKKIHTEKFLLMKNGKNQENPCMLLQREPKLREPLTAYAVLCNRLFQISSFWMPGQLTENMSCRRPRDHERIM